MSARRVDFELSGRHASFVPVGSGPALVCIPGGPGLPGAHLGGLAGLDQERALVRPDWRGAGVSDPPADGSLVVTGEHDVTFGAECAGQLASVCASATVGVIPGAGHFTWVEPRGWRHPRFEPGRC